LQKRRAAIEGISSYLPSSVLTNEQLVKDFKDWDVEKIYNKTGIAKRHIASQDECASDLGIAAAEKLFAKGPFNPNSIDVLLFCTETPDYFLPASACIIQDRLGLRKDCGALDFNLGCSGFIYGLALAKGLVEIGLADQVLLITADTYSKLIHPMDRSVRTLFGDGAAATLISPVMADEEFIGPFVFGTDGGGAGRLIVPAGGFRLRSSHETAIARDDGTGNIRSLENIYMDGPEIFNFSLREVPKTVTELLQKANITKEDVDFFIFHQANKFMIEQLRRKLKIPVEKFCINMESYGNTVSATIPMAMEIAGKTGQIKPGDTIMLVGFGVGYSWGGTIIKYDIN
jgi:3-oxoacyl-[acyl-carrier-protein] synthase III